MLTVPEDFARAKNYRGHQPTGLVLGPVLFALILALPPPADLSAAGWATAAVAVLMAVWWATEALPLAATALVPLVLFPLLGIFDVQQTAAPFASPLIFFVPWEILILFGGGLSLAQGIDRTGLAAWLGGGLEFLTGGPIIILVAGVTVFVILLTELTSNTATTAAFLPVAGAWPSVPIWHRSFSSLLWLWRPQPPSCYLSPHRPTPSTSGRATSPCRRCIRWHPRTSDDPFNGT